MRKTYKLEESIKEESGDAYDVLVCDNCGCLLDTWDCGSTCERCMLKASM